MFDTNLIDANFPKETYRTGQRECIKFVADQFNNGKQIVILECPTGSGKSPIGVTLMNMVNTSFYLTSTKQLQDQLRIDFPKIVELKGRNAYPCTYYNRYGQKLLERKAITNQALHVILNQKPNCSEGYCRLGNKTKCEQCFMRDKPYHDFGTLSSLPIGMDYSACPYYEQVYKAINSPQVLMNYNSFLYQTMTDRFGARDLMIVDESHNIEQQLLDFINFTISDMLLKRISISVPQLESAEAYAIWLAEIEPQLLGLLDTTEDPKLVDEIDKVLYKIRMFIDHISNSETEWITQFNKGAHNSVTIKPVTIEHFVYPLLFKYAKRVVMMSATILDPSVICKSLGLNKSQVASYRMKNHFPVKNRPIFYKPAGVFKGGRAKMDTWIKPLIASVNGIVNKYQGQKGIIHTHNFDIMDAIISRCEPKVKSRMLDQRKFGDKSAMLQHHANSVDTVIVAPAMHEGVSLDDDLSRFQILCKIPYPNYFDNEQLKRRMEIDNNYYTWLVALKTVQSVGRSIRSGDDYADTYIIDGMFERFFKDASRMLPDWFTEAIVWN